MAEKFLVQPAEDEEVSLELRREGDTIFLRNEGEVEWRSASLERVGDSGLYVLMIDNRPLELYIERRRGGAKVTIGRHAFDCNVGPWRPPSARASAQAGVSGRRNVNAPMTGSIVEVRVTTGQAVEQGDVLLVVESMKMNNELRSPVKGTVAQVQVVAGQKVVQGTLLVAIET